MVSERVIDRRTRLVALLRQVLDPSLGDQVDSVVHSLVDEWNSGTKDNYLHKFEVFVSWLHSRGVRVLDEVSPTLLL